MEIKLKKWQDGFVFSPKRYPGMWSSWATGKNMSLILRAMLYSELIPDNLGIIFRKEYTDLRDSTVKDFEKYTRLKVDSQRCVTLKNRSQILFRHIEEMNNIQNVNLGWFGIEQGDELSNDSEFFLLFGRLRRQVSPTDEFTKLKLPERSGFVIGNAGDHWGKRLWRDGALDGGELFEATTYDNADVLPKDFLDSLKVLEKNKPEVYKQYVMNDWSVSADQFTLIKPAMLELLKQVTLYADTVRRVIACDPATGGDECVIYAFENGKKVDECILHINDTMKIAGEMVIMAQRYGTNNFAVDAIGIGKGIADRLSEMGKNVNAIFSANKATNDERFYNLRTEMWWHTMEQIQNRNVYYPEDEELRKQLASVRYRVINSNGKVQLEPKDETKKRLGRSPDRADAFVYGLWAMKELAPEENQTVGISFDHHFAGGRSGY